MFHVNTPREVAFAFRLALHNLVRNAVEARPGSRVSLCVAVNPAGDAVVDGG